LKNEDDDDEDEDDEDEERESERKSEVNSELDILRYDKRRTAKV
jgi:hypothetical protein